MNTIGIQKGPCDMYTITKLNKYSKLYGVLVCDIKHVPYSCEDYQNYSLALFDFNTGYYLYPPGFRK